MEKIDRIIPMTINEMEKMPTEMLLAKQNQLIKLVNLLSYKIEKLNK